MDPELSEREESRSSLLMNLRHLKGKQKEDRGTGLDKKPGEISCGLDGSLSDKGAPNTQLSWAQQDS